ncbi:MAG TPA: UDP-2,3-diacylglucosamine diphosphatase [Verrucomicrobiae bacterium]|jgi:UDP-2,3-diacylglucosamine pyrophosphatase LpxH|nr:UDP-2,3-diacylglucosamine diphosphatase [Verrucomicrobiae bacterium]
MDLPAYNTLILSDLHLGAEMSHAREATRVLKENRFERLILLGDIFADLNFARLTKEHWKFLGLIRKLSNPKRKIEVVWVEGNHDHGLADIMSHLVGVRVYHHYEWTYRGLRHLAIHGHQFDGFQVNQLRLSRVGTSLYLALQKLDFKKKPIVRLIDRLNTRWLRMSSKVSAGALEYARRYAADRVFCGHTHEALRIEQEGIEYYNSGGWVDSRLTYLTIDELGVQIHDYHERTDDRDSGEERSEADSSFTDFADESGLLENVEYESVGR